MGENTALLKLLTTPTLIKLSVAESLTSGNLQAAIGAISGISACFEGGITAYNVIQKHNHLGIDQDFAEKCRCVDPRVADEMARGVCELFNTEIGAATTGFAEPNELTNVPYAFWSIYHSESPDKIVCRGRVDGSNLDRIEVQKKVTDAVMAALISYLQTFRTE